MLKVEMKDIVEAYGRIRNYVQKTPLIYSPETSERTGSEVWFKMENLQPIGAYKLRGAMNNILGMSEEDLKWWRLPRATPPRQWLTRLS